MGNTIRLTWGQPNTGAVSYNIYHSNTPGVSIGQSQLIGNTTQLIFTHTGLLPSSTHYYVVVAVGPNGEQSPPSNEVGFITTALSSIAITPANLHILNGATQQYTATGTLADSSMINITNFATWQSSLTSIATISNTGFLTTNSIGTSTISATLNSVSGNTSVVVISLVSIAITPANPTIVGGTTQQMTATGTYTDSSQTNLTTQVTWQSSDNTKATVSNTGGSQGLVTAITNGTAIITATLNSISGNTTVTIVFAVPSWTKQAQVGGPTSQVGLLSAVSLGDAHTYIGAHNYAGDQGAVYAWDGLVLSNTYNSSGAAPIQTIWAFDITGLWVGGQFQTFQKSIDGGYTFTTQSAPDATHLADILYIAGTSASTFYLLQNFDTAHNLYKTTNNGAAFTAQTLSSATLVSAGATAVNAIGGNGPTNIYVLCSVNSGSQIFHSTGNNAVWTATPTWPGGTSDGNGPNSASIFVDSTGRLFVGTKNGNGNGHLFITTNGGSTWTTATINGLTNQYCMISVGNADDNHLYAAAGTSLSMNMYFSSNNGVTWSALTAIGEFVNSIFCVSNTEVYVCTGYGGGGGVWVSTDGVNFTKTALASTYSAINFYTVWGVNGAVYAGGGNSVVIYSTNHGTTWTQQTVDSISSQNIVGIWGTSSSDIYVVGGSGASPMSVYHSNGSGTWVLQSTGGITPFGGPTSIWGTVQGGMYVPIYSNGLPQSVHLAPVTGLARAIYFSPNNSSAFYVAGDGFMSYFDGNGFNKTLYYKPNPTTVYNTIWVSSINSADGYVYAGGYTIGSPSRAIIIRADAATLQNFTDDTIDNSTGSVVYKISGYDETHIWAAVNTGSNPATAPQDNELRKRVNGIWRQETMINGDDPAASMALVLLNNSSRGVAGAGNDGYFYSHGSLLSWGNAFALTGSSPAPYLKVYGFADNDIYISALNLSAPSGTVYHYNGVSYTSVFTTSNPISYIWGPDNGHVFALGRGTSYISTNGGTTWNTAFTTPGSSAYTPGNMWGSSNTDFYVVATDNTGFGAFYHTTNGSSFTTVNTNTGGAGTPSVSYGWVHGLSASDIWVLGTDRTNNGNLYVSHYNGTNWTHQSFNTGDPYQHVYQILAHKTVSGVSEAFIGGADSVGGAGHIWRVNTSGSLVLQSLTSGTSHPYYTIYGNSTSIYAGQAGGLIFQWNGEGSDSFQNVSSLTSDSAYGIWVNPISGFAITVGLFGNVITRT